MRGAFERRVGDAGQHAPEIGSLLAFLENAPKCGVSRGNQQENGDDGAHRDKTIRGCILGKRTRPLGSADTALERYLCHAI